MRGPGPSVGAVAGTATETGERLLYVQDRFPVLSETFVSSEIAELRSWGHEVSVTNARHPLVTWPAALALSSEGRPLRGVVAGHWSWLRRSPRRYLAYLRVLAQVPVEDKPFALLAPVVALEARRQRVTHVHTHLAFRAASVARAVAALLDCSRSVTTHANDLFTRGVDLGPRVAGAEVVTISRYNQAYLADRGIPSRVVHCGVDVARLRGLVPPGAPRSTDVLFVGRLVAKKGPLDFLRAVRELADGWPLPLTVVMVGDGPLRAACEAYVVEHALPVTFRGPLPAGETLAETASAKVLCLPCREAPDGDMDGIPVVLMEAMAMGAAVVTTALSGIPELVDDDTGWLVADDGTDRFPARLASAIVEVLGDGPDARQRVVRAGERVASGFTLRRQAEGIVRLAQRGAHQGARRG